MKSLFPYLRTALTLAVISPLLTACPPSSDGQITNEIRDNLEFVDDDQRLFYTPTGDGEGGIIRSEIDGSDQLVYFSEDFRVRSVAANASVWVLGDPDNELYTLHIPGQSPERVDYFDGRVADARLAGDGQTIAAVRHADYDLPQEEQVADDAIYLIDAHTHDVQVIDATTEDRISFFFWLDDGQSIYYQLLTSGDQYIVDTVTGQRQAVEDRPDNLAPQTRQTPTRCEATGGELMTGDEGISISYENGERVEPLVDLEGRERGFHDYQATFEQAFFSDSCNTVIFEFRRALWVVDVESRIVGKFADGQQAFILADVD